MSSDRKPIEDKQSYSEDFERILNILLSIAVILLLFFQLYLQGKTMIPTVSLTSEAITVTEGKTLIWNFHLDRPAPKGGLSLFLPITSNSDFLPKDVEYFTEGSSNITDFEFVFNNEPISQVYAFGDSYSDNGLSREISTDAVNAGVPDSVILPADPELGLYDPEGRWTNGLTSVEVLSQNLDVDLTNYAVGGATSGDGNFFSWLDSFQNTGLPGQVEQFSADLVEQPADPNALYFIYVSANDFFEDSAFDLPTTESEVATQTVANIKQQIEKLSALGAEKFFVANSSDLGILPSIVEAGAVENADLFTNEFNELLPQELSALESELSVDLVLYDHKEISDEIRENPLDYGLNNLNDPYQPLLFTDTDLNPDEYYFWDDNHPTRRVHEIIGEDMANYVDFEANVTGINLTIAEGETNATLVSEAVSEALVEGEERFAAVVADSFHYLVDRHQNQIVNNTRNADASSDLATVLLGGGIE